MDRLTPHDRQTPWLETACAVLLACIVLLPRLGHRPLTAWDEGIYAEIAREMLTRPAWSAWLVPHWNGQLWLEKPPLAMWLTAVSLRVLGVTTLAARLPSALAGVALVGILYAWLRRYAGRLAAVLGVVVLLSAFGFQHAARVGETDTLLSLFSFVSILGLAGVSEGRPRGWVIFWAGFALALMTKGAASLPLPLSVLGMMVLHPQRLLRFRKTRLLGGGLFLLLVAPWHAYVASRFHQAFQAEYLGLHVLHRATSAIEGHSTRPWFYLWVLLTSAPLFSLLFPFALAAPFARAGTARRDAVPLQALAIYALLLLVLFSAVQTRLPHYVAPAYPPLAVVTGVLLADFLGRRSRKTLVTLGCGGVLAYGVAAFLTAPARRTLHSAVLPGGRATPDNREAAALLQQVARRQDLPPGPLLVWHADPQTPVTTEAFYAGRLVQPVTAGAASASDSPGSLEAGSRYAPAAIPLTTVPGPAHLLLVDRAFLPRLGASWSLRPLATGLTEAVGIVSRAGPGGGDAAPEEGR